MGQLLAATKAQILTRSEIAREGTSIRREALDVIYNKSSVCMFHFFPSRSPSARRCARWPASACSAGRLD